MPEWFDGRVDLFTNCLYKRSRRTSLTFSPVRQHTSPHFLCSLFVCMHAFSTYTYFNSAQNSLQRGVPLLHSKKASYGTCTPSLLGLDFERVSSPRPCNRRITAQEKKANSAAWPSLIFFLILYNCTKNKLKLCIRERGEECNA